MKLSSLMTTASGHDAGLATPRLDSLAEQTQGWAAPIFDQVASHYLAFRRVYYHELDPRLSTAPNPHAEIRQADIARLADSSLRVLPPALRAVPLLGDLLEHLQQVANIHSISERERTALHNLTLVFLHGVRDGIQPWLVEWLLDCTHNLSGVTDPAYFMTFPWDALLYRDPSALAALEGAVRAGDTPAIQREVEQVASALIRVLDDPIALQPELAFTGPDSAHRKRVFGLKTSAALALGAYLAVEEARTVLHPHVPAELPRSALAPLPSDAVAVPPLGYATAAPGHVGPVSTN
jgi:hypothetical protein